MTSGYRAQAESVDGRRHLHAWPEVWSPGTGWQGFDPMHGIRVTDGHAVHAPPHPAKEDAGRGGITVLRPGPGWFAASKSSCWNRAGGAPRRCKSKRPPGKGRPLKTCAIRLSPGGL
ncbi:transglutaminase domain-containing protein [Salipiger aestuarii]|uniref:transglutaminase domain-containing protein n=1 Tax=Salipiger aestuarii TaxID=568098 RepID=UPI001CC30D19